jgi:hypothetical protein
MDADEFAVPVQQAQVADRHGAFFGLLERCFQTDEASHCETVLSRHYFG